MNPEPLPAARPFGRSSDAPNSPSLQNSIAPFAPPAIPDDELRHRGALPIGECLAIGAKLASALEHLHAQGLVHRDIKPSNIIFVRGEPKLADIGLVTNIDEAHSMVGTAGYIPPEGPGAAQADIYSLGKVLYEIAFGKDRQEFPQLPPDLQAHPDHASLLELNEILLKACAVDPRQRYVNAAAMLADLDRLCGGKSVRRAHQGERRWRLIRRGAGWVAVAAVALTLIALASRVRRPSVELGRGDEGPPSTNNEANMLYNHAIGI